MSSPAQVPQAVFSERPSGGRSNGRVAADIPEAHAMVCRIIIVVWVFGHLIEEGLHLDRNWGLRTQSRLDGLSIWPQGPNTYVSHTQHRTRKLDPFVYVLFQACLNPSPQSTWTVHPNLPRLLYMIIFLKNKPKKELHQNVQVL